MLYYHKVSLLVNKIKNSLFLDENNRLRMKKTLIYLNLNNYKLKLMIISLLSFLFISCNSDVEDNYNYDSFYDNNYNNKNYSSSLHALEDNDFYLFLKRKKSIILVKKDNPLYGFMLCSKKINTLVAELCFNVFRNKNKEPVFFRIKSLNLLKDKLNENSAVSYEPLSKENAYLASNTFILSENSVSYANSSIIVLAAAAYGYLFSDSTSKQKTTDHLSKLKIYKNKISNNHFFQEFKYFNSSHFNEYFYFSIYDKRSVIRLINESSNDIIDNLSSVIDKYIKKYGIIDNQTRAILTTTAYETIFNFQINCLNFLSVEKYSYYSKKGNTYIDQAILKNIDILKNTYESLQSSVNNQYEANLDYAKTTGTKINSNQHNLLKLNYKTTFLNFETQFLQSIDLAYQNALINKPSIISINNLEKSKNLLKNAKKNEDKALLSLDIKPKHSTIDTSKLEKKLTFDPNRYINHHINRQIHEKNILNKIPFFNKIPFINKLYQHILENKVSKTAVFLIFITSSVYLIFNLTKNKKFITFSKTKDKDETSNINAEPLKIKSNTQPPQNDLENHQQTQNQPLTLDLVDMDKFNLIIENLDGLFSKDKDLSKTVNNLKDIVVSLGSIIKSNLDTKQRSSSKIAYYCLPEQLIDVSEITQDQEVDQLEIGKVQCFKY